MYNNAAQVSAKPPCEAQLESCKFAPCWVISNHHASFIQAHAKQAAWTGESLRSAPAEPEDNREAIARDASLPLHSQPPTSTWTAPKAPPEPCANLGLQDAARQVRMEDHVDLVRSYASLHREHSLILARLNSLQCEREAADSDRSTALAQLEEMRHQHADAWTELGVRLQQLDSLQQEMIEVRRQRTAMLSALEALEAEVQSHESLEAEHENLLSANGRTHGEHELLQVEHQELSREHAVLAHSFQQVKKQCKELEEEVQQLLARQRQHDLAQEQHSVTLAELGNTHQAYSADLHRLQEEVLGLEDTLHTAELLHKSSKAALEEQLRQAGKQQSEQYSKYVSNLQELEEFGAQRHSLEVELDEADHRHRELQTQSAHLQRRLQHSQDGALNLQRSLDEAMKQLCVSEVIIKVSDSRCSMLERQLAHSRGSHADVQSELAVLQADLKKLHDLAAGNRLTAEDLHQMFAKPVSFEDTTSHSLPASDVASASASTAAATAADGGDHVGGKGADQPSADEPGLCSDPPAEGETRPTHATSYAEPGPASTPEATAAALGWTVSTPATNHGQFGKGSSAAADDSSGATGTELKGEESGSDGEGVDIPIENNTWDQKAAYLQEQLAAHPDLKLTSALDIGAKAYASSAPEHCFSTQEVILSMLQHDERFLELLRQRSRDEGIDPLSLELAVADSYRSLTEREAGQFGAGKWPYKHTTQLPVSHPPKYVRNKTLFGINMIIPYDYAKVDQIALEALYQYWGIMYVNTRSRRFIN
ncbi:hypothetical protein ABBQ32_001015 [Trebouxia sp. C0010 RCD-2024]